MKARQLPGEGGGLRRRKWEEKVSRYLNNRVLEYVVFFDTLTFTSGTAEESLHSFAFSENPYTTLGDRVKCEVSGLFSGAGVGTRYFRIKLGATLGAATTLVELSFDGPHLFRLTSDLTLESLDTTTMDILATTTGFQTNVAIRTLLDSALVTPSITFPQTLFFTMEDPVGTGFLSDVRIIFENGAID